MGLKIQIKETRFYLRRIETRLPFRFGAYTLRKVPLLHLAVEAESEDGTRVRGVAADNLMPKWFDKDPAKTPADNIGDLLLSARIARDLYVECGRAGASLWEIWREAYPRCLRTGRERGLNPLVSSFGSSLFERALVDAVGKFSRQDLSGILRKNLLGIRPADVHLELTYEDFLSWAGENPLAALSVRHTVGLLDPLDSSDLSGHGEPRDDLPVTLEEYILRHGLRFFKLKIGGLPEEDFERLRRIASVLDRLLPGPYRVTLDGNEQYRSLDEIIELVRRLRETPEFTRFYHSIAFVEQPLERRFSLETGLKKQLEELSAMLPVIIDESDDRLDAFKTAVGVGYRGVSTKNCKGVMKSFLNRSLVARWNRERVAGEPVFMTAEDLTNVPVVPLQQDLATVRVLGIPHLERNGFHYVRGLAHCSERERELAIRFHGDLYEGNPREAFMRIEDGQIRVGSLSAPGYGIAFDPDFESMEPWDIEKTINF
jgi:L-alanine-DL-glutamate epimerase-like enolase superfamily enzyme